MLKLWKKAGSIKTVKGLDDSRRERVFVELVEDEE
jgi:hypothetical protein